MVGRRQLRENLLKVLYAYSKNNQTPEVIEKNMMQSLEKIYALYANQLNLLLAIRDEALDKIEIAKNKNFQTEEDKNPNLKFVQNRVFEKIENNSALKEFNSKNTKGIWKDESQYVQAIWKKFSQSELYKKYMHSGKSSFEEDKDLIIKLFDNYIAKNDNLIDLYEEKEISWADDFHIANSMTLKTLKFIEEDKSFNSLLKVFKGEDDKKFVQDLMKKVLKNQKDLDEEIEKKLVNWELNRIAEMDKLILQMALTELIYMPDIPPRVVINEYIELAKTFSTPSSNVFINGILDNFVKEKHILNN